MKSKLNWETNQSKLDDGFKGNESHTSPIHQSSYSYNQRKRDNGHIMSNKRYEMINENILQNNKKLNNLIENYNGFLDRYEQQNFDKMKVIDTLQKEVGKLDENLQNTRRTKKVKPLNLESRDSLVIEEKIRKRYRNPLPNPRNKAKKKKKRGSQEESKSQNAYTNFFNTSQEKVYQYLVMAQILGDNKEEKQNKRKVDDIKKVDQTVHQHEDFLMFLMNKKSISHDRNNTTNNQEIMERLNRIENKLTKTQHREKKIRSETGKKMQNIHSYLNQNLFKNYQILSDINTKNNFKTVTPIFIPRPFINNYKTKF